MNLLAIKCKYNQKDALKIDTMVGIIQGLKLLYMDHGQNSAWNPGRPGFPTSGNPLIKNPGIDLLKRTIVFVYPGLYLRISELDGFARIFSVLMQIDFG